MIKPMLHLVNRIYSEISLISNSVLLRNYKIYNLSVLFKTQLGQFFTKCTRSQLLFVGYVSDFFKSQTQLFCPRWETLFFNCYTILFQLLCSILFFFLFLFSPNLTLHTALTSEQSKKPKDWIISRSTFNAHDEPLFKH